MRTPVSNSGRVLAITAGRGTCRRRHVRSCQSTKGRCPDIAFGEKIPAVDGNLLRVFARLALYEEEIKTPAASAAAKVFFMDRMPQDRPGDFNQALMDLGAGICTPGSAPRCGDCPLRDCCRAAAVDRAGELPVMPAKKARSIEKRTILVIRDEDKILLRRRPARGLLAGLYEFPNEAGWLSEDQAVRKAREYGCEPLHIRALADARHVFTHKEWHMRGYEIRIGSFPENAGNDMDRKISLEAEAVKGNPEEERHAAMPGNCFITTIRSLQKKYALPSAYAVYFPHTAPL